MKTQNTSASGAGSGRIRGAVRSLRSVCQGALAAALVAVPSLHASDEGVSREKPALLPMPQQVEWANQAVPVKSLKVTFPGQVDDALRFAQLKEEVTELLKSNGVTHSNEAEQALMFRLGKVDVPNQWQGQEREAYQLVSEPRGVSITANDVSGLYAGLQTLRQLMVHQNGETTVAACKVQDYPAFKIRGLMHDVGRNFQTIDQLKMQIDVMAKHKLNVFHWHLTDHYGWRLESKIYPELQSDKAFGRWHGKYYTQEEFKDMVDYCWARGIIIIPEFDTPGHSEAFRHGLEIPNMKDPRAIEAICKLVDEVCTLAPKERMPYIHIGTDEVRHRDEYVNADYLPTLHKAVQDNGREVIGWCKGMTFKGAKQIAQTWAQSRPWGGAQHIDSRANYINHLEAMDFAQRMFFQQPCRQPHGDDIQLGGILAYWPDTLTDDEKRSLTNSPVVSAMVAYSEAVWKGVEKDRPEYWAKIPPKGTPEYDAYADFEDRLAEIRDRFHTDVPFLMVKGHDIEWRLLGPVEDGLSPELEQGIVKDRYEVDGKPLNWTKPVYGGAIHVKHFFGFKSHLSSFPKGRNIVWANTHVYSPKDQEVDAWINFNTISTSDPRAGVAQQGEWGANPACDIWLNGERIAPPKWQNKGKAAKEIALIDEVYTSREPAKIKLKKGWNTVLIKSAPTWKWVFTFVPVEKDGPIYREVEGLKYSAAKPE
ncbi:family 20 glycosylhydrolase [Sulfuriroseicoccus oceanibius]|uniref:beta-N-acetylhexosaminidase n=1 Tax=Sulfuriroseicoccus oceanibius TaxID=2707525 RepID=A0A6B3L321_9BACT|nr:family 20 glycosylhydrolase [Sulfuriroseicoccus oceanibius]QQL45315.1 beta-N-acetylhexosaminidase [Sulfuriroseicoccus oceanibius]